MNDFLGKTIAGYQLVDTLDEAGTALVYRGFQPSMNRYVAVKLLKPGQSAEPGVVQQFLQEGELLAKMDHPRILDVIDTGKEEEVVYRVIRYAENRSLNEHRDWFYEPRAAFNLINDVVDALGYIHNQGYIHGNIQPSKILLNAERRALLTDFGFPRSAAGGITAYMAPEQVQGGVVDRRADVYALGVLLYEMLVGQAPPAGTVVSPRTHRPELPEALERVVFKAMAQNPDARFQTAGEFRNALDAALRPVAPAPQPVTAAPSQPTAQPAAQPARSAPPPRRGTNWAAIILGFLLIALVCVGGFYIGSQLIGGDAETPIEPTQPPPVEASPVPPTEAPPEQPPTEPPPEQPTDEPGEPPGEGGNPIEDLCGSLGLVLGAVALGGVWTSRQRRRMRYDQG